MQVALTVGIHHQKSPPSDLIWRVVAHLAAWRSENLPPLAKKLVRTTCSKSNLFVELNLILAH